MEKDSQKCTPKIILVASRAPFGCGLGASWPLMGRSRACLGRPSGVSWTCLGASWTPVGSRWAPKSLWGRFWVDFGKVWGGFRGPLGRSWGTLGRSRGVPGRSWGTPRAPKSAVGRIFCLGRFWEGFGGIWGGSWQASLRCGWFVMHFSAGVLINFCRNPRATSLRLAERHNTRGFPTHTRVG